MLVSNIKNILIICAANTCRSPMTEYFMAQQLLDNKMVGINVSSAGLRAKQGSKINDFAYDVLNNVGIDATNHRSQIMSQNLYDDSDLILAMEVAHIDEISRLYGANTNTKGEKRVLLLGKWHNDCEIDDPYAKGYEKYKFAFEKIKESVLTWITKL